LAEDSFRQSIKLLKEGSDTERYKQAVQGLQAILPDDPEAQIDEEWLEETTKKVATGIEKYEAQLHSYKHNLIKESIRVCGLFSYGTSKETLECG
jgi:COP9 signalosome complex subunit 1